MDALHVIEAIVGVIAALIVGFIGFSTGRKQAKDEGAVLRTEAEKTLTETQAKARQILVESKDEALKTRESADKELKERRNETQREEDRLKKRRDEIEQLRDKNEQRDKKLNQRQTQLDKREGDLDKLQKERLGALESKLLNTPLVQDRFRQKGCISVQLKSSRRHKLALYMLLFLHITDILCLKSNNSYDVIQI